MRLSLGLNRLALAKQQKRFEKFVKNDEGELTPLLKQLGLQVQTWHVENFRTGGRRILKRGWKAVSWWAAVLRKNAGKKLKNWGEIFARTRTLSPLRDTGELMRSIMGQGTHAVMKFRKLGVEVGTAVQYADLHNEGGTKVFRVDAGVLDKLKSTIGEELSGSIPKTTPTGRASRAKKRWNPLYFQILGKMRQSEGKAKTIPARRIVFKDKDLNATDMKILGEIVTNFMKVKKVVA